MSNILDAQKKVLEFFTAELEKERAAVRFIKLSKVGEGWEVRVEVTEPNEYLKKIGYPKIFDKNIYTVSLDNTLEVVGYALTASRERSYTTETREEIE